MTETLIGAQIAIRLLERQGVRTVAGIPGGAILPDLRCPRPVQMTEILRARLAARKIDIKCLEFGDVETNVAGARQKITVKQGIERELAKKIQYALKASKIKVDSQINGDKLRVNGKKRDDLQAAMALLRGTDFELPLQFDNFRD